MNILGNIHKYLVDTDLEEKMAFIEANEVKIQSLLSNSQEAYQVPLYQRPYTWTKDHWDDLFDDVVNMSPKDVHFLGSIVVVPQGEHKIGVNYFQIVDGQQRLATLLIWLSALRDIAKERGHKDISNHIEETFLFSKDLESGKQKKVPKLALGQLDNDAFQMVLNGEKRKHSHRIFDCYDYFKEQTKSEELWTVLLNNVSIVHINAFNHFNAFRLFETLNDRGLELSAADLIKNYILMSVSSKKEIFQETINEWNEMYEKVREIEPVKFIRRYVLGNYKGKTSEARLYEEIRKKLENESKEKLLMFTQKLNQSATIYKKIIDVTFSSPKLNEKLQQLHLIEVAPSFTLLLKVIPYFEADRITETVLIQIVNMIEIFHIRWGVCAQSTSRLDSIYNEICTGLNDKKPNEFVEFIKQKITNEIKSNVDDEIFLRNFKSRTFRSGDSRTKYILWRLNEPTGETLLNLKDVQTEHILPQGLSKRWIDYLNKITKKTDEQIFALHQESLHRIGNLTLILGDWNRTMSNRLFEEKKNEYKNSEFSLTKKLINFDEWSFDEINSRSENLAESSLDIWKW